MKRHLIGQEWGGHVARIAAARVISPSSNVVVEQALHSTATTSARYNIKEEEPVGSGLSFVPGPQSASTN